MESRRIVDQINTNQDNINKNMQENIKLEKWIKIAVDYLNNSNDKSLRKCVWCSKVYRDGKLVDTNTITGNLCQPIHNICRYEAEEDRINYPG